MECFNDYWKKKSTKRKTSWEKKNEQYAAKHYQLETIREIVFTPIDYDRRGYNADAFVNTYFKVTNPFAQWDQGIFHFSESAFKKSDGKDRLAIFPNAKDRRFQLQISGSIGLHALVGYLKQMPSLCQQMDKLAESLNF